MLFHSTTAFQIGGLAIKWYGLFIMAGVIAATLLAYRIAPLKGEDPEHMWGLLPYLVVFGIVGARITYGIVRHEQFASPIEWVTKFRTGGIAIQGAILGACIAGYVYCRFKGILFLRWADIIAPGLSLAQGMGRWGNYANQEEFGRPTTLPWGIAISPDRLEAKGLPPGVRVHPAFLYESVADVSIAAILLFLFVRVMRPKRWRDGDIFGAYGILYGITRFFTESIRVDRAHIGPLPGAYWASAAFIIIGGALILFNRRLPPPVYHTPTRADEDARTVVPDTIAAPTPAAIVTTPATDERDRRATLTRAHTRYRRALPPPAPVRSVDEDDDDGALT